MRHELHVSHHPLVHDKLTRLRARETGTLVFRSLLRELSALLAYEACSDLATEPVAVETPVGPAMGKRLSSTPAIVSVLRAGNGMVDGFLEVIPDAVVGHVGVSRDPGTLEALEYYRRLPPRLRERDVLVLDPMLATGNTARVALGAVEEARPRSLRFVCLIAAPEGIAALREAHPRVAIYTAAVDERLDEHGYIVPGLGDAGDRLFGT